MSPEETVFWAGYLIGALSWGFLCFLVGMFVGEFRRELFDRIVKWKERI